ncbi:putative cytochrome P450 [Choiromyces venosus 120613-1]|uniref:Putative cytochrome P450 n=1 Tax=Choiromyces venosus 120613-1 TaxID=1336337 RepID=A0A3N4K7P9_9PEZI|nr:putative cytochrome P450 [Choiromyces venosus 120613-1]
MAVHLRVSDLLKLSPRELLGGLGALFVVCFVWRAIYNLYFHPLAKVPGPRICAINSFYTSYHWVSGRYPYVIRQLHEKYGTAVRLAPNQVSFCSEGSWKEIYGHVGGRKQFLKSNFYTQQFPHIVNERDPIKHSEIRRLLSHGFSPRAVGEQEAYVHEYVDRFIQKVNIYATKKDSPEEGEEMTKWYSFLTFDIIGDLAFGEPFGSLDDGRPHFWVSIILDNIKAIAWSTIFRQFLILRPVAIWLTPKALMSKRIQHFEYSRDKIARRVQSKTTRKDFLSNMLDKKELKGITMDNLGANASILITAGSETTATFLSSTSFYLCRTLSSYQKLVNEIRSSFNSYNEITGQATENLTYLKAVIDEGLRIFPPVPIGMPRESPGENVEGIYIPKGVEVFTSSYSATHYSGNFHRPDSFIPERWIDPNCTDKKRASQPFLLGSRGCLGISLALLEMRVILAKMLWVYDMELMDPNLSWGKDTNCYVLWDKLKLPIRYTRRAGIVVPPLDG